MTHFQHTKLQTPWWFIQPFHGIAFKLQSFHRNFIFIFIIIWVEILIKLRLLDKIDFQIISFIKLRNLNLLQLISIGVMIFLFIMNKFFFPYSKIMLLFSLILMNFSISPWHKARLLFIMIIGMGWFFTSSSPFHFFQSSLNLFMGVL